jgi:hypothetical protein
VRHEDRRFLIFYPLWKETPKEVAVSPKRQKTCCYVDASLVFLSTSFSLNIEKLLLLLKNQTSIRIITYKNHEKLLERSPMQGLTLTKI